MATASNLLVGFKYEIKNGDFEGEIVTIKSNTPVPDGEPNQRKVLVTTPQDQEYYILPRQLHDVPVGMAGVENQTPTLAIPMTYVEIDDADEIDSIQPVRGSVREARKVYKANPITDPMDPRLDRFRPNKRKWNVKGTGQYQGRIMPNGMTDIDFFLKLTEDDYRVDPNNAGRPASLLLKGDTQSGKTMLVEALAIAWSAKMAAEQEARGEVVTYTKPMPIFTISGSQGVTDYDLFGQTTSYTDPESGEASLVWLPGMVELAAECGGILYIDETNALEGDVASSLHPLTDHRHMFVNRNKATWVDGMFMPEIQMAHMDLWVIGTMNEGYVGMNKTNEAFVNRFEPFVWEYDKDVEVKLVKSSAIRLFGDALRTAREKNTLKTPVGTAALIRCERNVRVMGTVMGLKMLTDMFNPNERPIVESIIEDRSILILLNEEMRQAEAEAAARA